MKKEVLAFIPAREGSKRIPGKNTKDFLGKPLIAYAIESALQSPHITRTIVCTESESIATIAKQYGAEVPFMRPQEMAGDESSVMDSMLYTLEKLKTDEGYEPTHFVILQTTSPLREQKDIDDCFRVMEETGATTVLTMTTTQPKFYNVESDMRISLVNGSEAKTQNAQAWPKGYIQNGAVYVIDVPTLLAEKRVVTHDTRAVVMPKWRSLDIDDPEEWVMAEVLYRNKEAFPEEA